MFKGVSNININATGRITIPTKYRDDILSKQDGKMVLTVDHAQNCLQLFPQERWEQVEKFFKELKSASATALNMKRMVIGHAQELVVDAQGRMVIPASLREFANLDKKIAFVGMIDKFELWNEQTWNNARDQWVTEIPEGIAQDEMLQGMAY